MEFAIETRGLSKSFGAFSAVQGVDLRVRRGEVYGFLGLNGAGKTTTIRMLLGMIRPTAGKVRILGESVGPHGRGPWARLGSLVEGPTAYPDLSVRENLEIARRLQLATDSLLTSRIIDLLGLAPYERVKAADLSTGNRQRLGLARALLHAPELLILDEPANGLDPAGVVEVRTLLARLAHEDGVTVFMSSHILTEVDRLATRIGIIHQGRLLEELDTSSLERLRSRYLAVAARDLDAAAHTLAAAGYEVNKSVTPGILALSDSRAVDAPDAVARLLVEAGVPPIHLAVVQEDLEQHFLKLTVREPRQVADASIPGRPLG